MFLESVVPCFNVKSASWLGLMVVAVYSLISPVLQEAMKAVKKQLHEFMHLCHELMYHQNDRINEEAYVTICDLLVVFSKQLGDNPVMKPLVYEPDKNLQGQLGGFLNDKVFVEEDDGKAWVEYT